MVITERYHLIAKELGDKIDELVVMIGKLATRDNGISRQFKPQLYQNKGRGQNRRYNQHSYENRYRSDSGNRKQYRHDRGRPRYEENYRRGNSRGNMGSYDRQNSRGHFSEAIITIEIGVQAIVGPGQDQEQAHIETEI